MKKRKVRQIHTDFKHLPHDWNLQPQIVRLNRTLEYSTTHQDVEEHANEILALLQLQNEMAIMNVFSASGVQFERISAAVFKFNLSSILEILSLGTNHGKVLEDVTSHGFEPLP